MRLWRDEQAIALTPKACEVLKCLVEHAGQLVTKDDLLTAVWPDAFVEESLLKTYIKRLRRVLGDEARTPQFIETVHRSGYRFLGTIRKTDTLGLLNSHTSSGRPPLFMPSPPHVSRND
ncbi:MAG: winged helix-turn-helix domain-containing protein [Candidatus Tectomicrobia bacterium]|nr:winged helix-turn-helix domain-containing protein [Candidatus Tectomicrobia bacterium]